MTSIYLNGIGISAPGLPGWPETRKILRGQRPYKPEATSPPQSNLIPEKERRRASATAKLAVHVAEQAATHAGADPKKLAAVFASFAGDLQIADRLCHALTLPERPVSPYQFHNSVHNAPAAYWSIATESMGPSTSIACADSSFAAALLNAVSYIEIEKSGVLLAAYDTATPEALAKFHPVRNDCGVALVLEVNRSDKSLAKLTISFNAETSLEQENHFSPDLRALLKDNAAGQALLLLEPVARKETRSVSLNYLTGSSVEVEVIPCL